ncbi:MAG TPA: DUF6584 family protein [Micromonosporaceae bacterium]|nr:DUF6584 family protein [Micromonosporaceae bacterium]
MAKADVLARVKDDLTLGHTYRATQRLRTLLAVDPSDIEVRRLLAAVYRQTGNLVEAGRWSFLTDDARPEELAAFIRANPSPWLRLRLLAWSEDLVGLPTEAARERLLALVEEAERSGPPSRWRGHYRAPDSRGALIPCLFVLVTVGIVVALAALGVVRFGMWILG